MNGDEWVGPTKYPGRCVSCGADVPAGRGDYRRGASGRWEVRHAAGKCPAEPTERTKPTRPKESTAWWSEEQIRAEAARQGREVMSAETLGWSQRIGSKRMPSGKRGPDMDTAPKLGSVFRGKGREMHMVVEVGKPWYMNRDDLEDMDMFFEEPGWFVGFKTVEVTETEADRTEREAAEAAKREREEAERRAKEEAERKRQEAERRWKEITAPPEGWTMLEGPAKPFSVTIATPEGTEVSVEDTVTVPPREEWVLEDEVVERTREGYLFRYAERYRAGPYVVLRYGSWDDDRIAVMVPPNLLDSYMQSEAKRRGVTPAAAREWLAKYRGCVGTALYEWVAAHEEEMGVEKEREEVG